MKKIVTLGLLGLLAVGGCARQQTQVTFTREAPRGHSGAPAIVYERFPGAYITSNRDGEYDIVLVNDTLRAARQEKRKKPLRPVSQPPLQQAIHIHVFWRPVVGAMVKESSVTNAIVHWYVFNGEASGGTDMVHYEGAAFVKLYPNGGTAEVTIGDGNLAPRQVRGEMTDPMGPSRITGTILAVRNDARVKELLAALREKAAGSERLWTEAEAEGSPVFGR